jgi:hypothetical protein
VALRMPRDRFLLVDGVDVVPRVHAVLDQMADFSPAPAHDSSTNALVRRYREGRDR